MMTALAGTTASPACTSVPTPQDEFLPAHLDGDGEPRGKFLRQPSHGIVPVDLAKLLQHAFLRPSGAHLQRAVTTVAARFGIRRFDGIAWLGYRVALLGLNGERAHVHLLTGLIVCRRSDRYPR